MQSFGVKGDKLRCTTLISPCTFTSTILTFIHLNLRRVDFPFKISQKHIEKIFFYEGGPRLLIEYDAIWAHKTKENLLSLPQPPFPSFLLFLFSHVLSSFLPVYLVPFRGAFIVHMYIVLIETIVHAKIVAMCSTYKVEACIYEAMKT